MYWRYQCGRALRIISYPSTDVFCPRCFGRFLHEIDTSPHPAFPPPHFLPHPFHSQHHQFDGHARRWVIYGRQRPVVYSTRPRVPLARPVSVPCTGTATAAHSLPADPAVHATGDRPRELLHGAKIEQPHRAGPAPAPSSAIESLPSWR
ncbi:hypothetical protein HU200_056492 [Digitaria exilis]|uniref:RING-type E3 ubiquitin transferase n=1 Tax=Digitaria exilis TaxID=1010633 RepID=A0A835AH65_9POAL|nr:hypothetical protein HU200_056492 [Digitaria exilis]